MKTINVIFVCLGNICRSPMAEAVFRAKVKDAGLIDRFHIDSAGTGDWHIGKRPHQGTRNILRQHDIAAEGLVARQVHTDDLSRFDYIIAMDESNENDLLSLGADRSKLFRFLDVLEEEKLRDVPDPYLTGNFEHVYDLVDRGSTRLLEWIRGRENI